MSDLLNTGVAWLAQQLAAHAAQSIAYTHSATTATLAAAVGQTTFAADRGDGGTVEWQSVDFVLPLADFVAAGFTLPERDDRIAWGGRTYEVLPVGAQCYRLDQTRGLLRISTKRIS